MNKLITCIALVFYLNICIAQNFQGQWKGSFVDNSAALVAWGGNRCDYVVDIEVSGKQVSGYSYTYFTDGGKKYYTICRLEGVADKKKKYLEIKETARTKTNVPVNISNSFQVHKLQWRKEGGNEILEGTWLPAPGQDVRNTGFGTTLLSKRQLTEISALAKKINAKKDPASSPERPVANAVVTPKKTLVISKTQAPKNVTAIAPKKPATAAPPVVNNNADTEKKVVPKIATTAPVEKILPPGFEKRDNAILKEVVVESSTVKIELYDNGDIDGDSVTLFYNGKLLLAHKRLTENAIALEIPVIPDSVNELVMYADNLGTFPPNTALMVVRDGNKRYEVRITSDLKKSGTIRFVYKKE